jgi:ABC-2 type transport system ATP-binding protein
MIEIKNLTKYYKNFCAVNNISLKIKKGEILGLLGPNGAGKTTTLRMLTGYFKPSDGSIKVNDYQIPDDLIQIKSLIGYLPESAPLYHNMLVYDYLEYVAKIKGLIDKEERFDRFLKLSDICGLSSIMAKPISDLSKGLKQRVGLAHAMMTDPEILILDEPTSGLDPNQIAEIRNIIKNIGREKTIIFSTHILSEAEATCDRIAIINNGRIVANDTTANLKSNLEQDSHVKISLTGASEEEALGVLQAIDPDIYIESAPSLESNTVSFIIKHPANKDVRSMIYLKIKQTDWILCEMAKESLGLEKIFQRLTMEEA